VKILEVIDQPKLRVFEVATENEFKRRQGESAIED
jgi:hypothetical protein